MLRPSGAPTTLRGRAWEDCMRSMNNETSIQQQGRHGSGGVLRGCSDLARIIHRRRAGLGASWEIFTNELWASCMHSTGCNIALRRARLRCAQEHRGRRTRSARPEQRREAGLWAGVAAEPRWRRSGVQTTRFRRLPGYAGVGHRDIDRGNSGQDRHTWDL